MKHNISVALLVAILFIHHLMVTVLHLLPKNPMTNYYGRYVHWYINPLFWQNWNLFAPEPATYGLKMFFRCQKLDGQWSEWKDPVDKLIKDHQKNRFTFRGKLIYVYHGVFRSILNAKIALVNKKKCKKENGQCLKSLIDEMYTLKEYKKINKFTSYLCAKGHDGFIHEFKVGKIYVRKFSKRNNLNIKRKAVFDSYLGKRDLKL